MKNAIIAFLSGLGISFIGSIPLGYLNIIAYDIYTTNGALNLSYFLLGIIVIECPVIYFIFRFIKTISSHPGLTKILETASIIFLIIITVITLLKKNDSHLFASNANLLNNAFIIGMLLNAVNFLQLPFWSGWSLYVINNNIIDVKGSSVGLFIIGAGTGTIAGMAIFVIFLSKLSTHIYGITNNIIVIIFLSLTLFQAFRFYRKYLNTDK